METKDIAGRAKSRDLAYRHSGHIRTMPKFFPLMNIRQVYLDRRHLDRRDRITNRHARVGVGGRVDDETVEPVSSFLDPRDQLPFDIRLPAFQFGAAFRRHLPQSGVDRLEVGFAVEMVRGFRACSGWAHAELALVACTLRRRWERETHEAQSRTVTRRRAYCNNPSPRGQTASPPTVWGISVFGQPLVSMRVDPTYTHTPIGGLTSVASGPSNNRELISHRSTKVWNAIGAETDMGRERSHGHAERVSRKSTAQWLSPAFWSRRQWRRTRRI